MMLLMWYKRNKRHAATGNLQGSNNNFSFNNVQVHFLYP